MASVDKRAENRINATLLPNPGPYLARIVNNVDPMKQGALEVELLRPVGNQKEVGGQLFNVRYLSPFYGVTPLDVTGTDPVEFNDTQKSYGFWAVPPDVGVTVMVIFVDSDPGQGFWIGCVQDALMNYMIPGIASSSHFQDRVRGNTDIEWEEVEETKKRYGEDIEYLPVGEVNRRIFKEGGDNAPTPNADVEANKKPVHPLAERLLIQGLQKDMARGHTTSSARRESPSNVYGWSTPGPLDKRKGAKQGKIGKVNDKIDRFVSRMGGHCIIMDDGNDRFLRKTRPWEGPPVYADLEAGEEGLVDFPLDEQIRIRTRKGAQILLHSTEDLIYITNSRGTAWMEFTSEGKIIMYAEDGIEQASGGDISLTSRRDMHFDVGRDHNKKVAASSTERVGATKTAYVEGSYFQMADGDMSHQAGNNYYMQAAYSAESRAQSVNMTGTNFQWAVGGNLLIDCTGKNFEVLASNIALTGTNDMHLKAATDIRLTSAAIDISAGDGSIIASASSGIFMKSGAGISTESASNTTIHSEAQLNLTGKASLSASSSAPIKLAGKTVNIKASGNIVQKGAEIHLNGPDPEPADPAETGLDNAKEAVPAAPAGAAASPVSAGGGREFPVDLASYVYPSDAGGTLSVLAPNRQPYAWAENMGPKYAHQANTDARNMSKEYPSGQMYRFGRRSDFDNVPFADGGGSDGTINVGYRFGAGHLPNLGKSHVSGPLNKDYLSNYPLDWTKDQEFLSKTSQVASSLGVQREDLLAVFAIESTKSMNPSIRSPGGTRVGLIQMGEKEAQSVGTSTAKLRNMSRAEQLDYIQKYFQSRSKGRIDGVGGLYLLVAAPAKANIPDNQEVYKRGTKAWHQNPSWRENGPSGKITKRSITKAVEKYKDWVQSVLGSGQNSGAQRSGQGPRSAVPPSGGRPQRASSPPSSNISPNRASPSNSGTNKPWIRLDGSGETLT